MTNVIDRVGANLSIVLQGFIGSKNRFNEVVSSFRRIAPAAEIIVSTWAECAQNAVDYDKLVLSDDPGGINLSELGGRKENNFNRQLLSSKRGLEKSSRLFSLKVRSDISAKNDNFITLYNKTLEESLHYDKQYFNDKPMLLISTHSSKNPRLYPAYLHFCDWFILSETSHVYSIFDMPLLEREDFSFGRESEIPDIYFKKKFSLERWSSETLLWKNYAANLHSFNMTHTFHNTPEIRDVHEELLSTCLIIVDEEMSGLYIEKKGYKDLLSFKSCYEYSFEDWALSTKRRRWNFFEKVKFNFRCSLSNFTKFLYRNYLYLKKRNTIR